MPANHQQSDYKPHLVLSSNPGSADISHVFPSSTKKALAMQSPTIDIAAFENTPSFYKMTSNTQNTSKHLTQGVCNGGDDDAGVFADLDMLADKQQMLTIDHQPQASHILYKPNKQSSLVAAK